MESKDNDFMCYRTPADMHGDGVHFNKELLNKKRHKDLKQKQLDSLTKKNINS